MNDISITIARKQKRILDWKRAFAANLALTLEERNHINQSLSTLNLLLGKLISASGDELIETQSRIESLEREIINLYEISRLLTAKQGAPAITD